MEQTKELYALFRRCLPTVVRAGETAKAILAHPENVVLTRRDADGRLVAGAVLRGDALLLLCTLPERRGEGLGSALLREAEALARARGCGSLRIGAGADYLAPGVPTDRMPFPEALAGIQLDAGLDDAACAFLRRRGYVHGWGPCNCFDLRLDLDAVPEAALIDPERPDGVRFRWALPEERPAVCEAVFRAEEPFAQYYDDPALYREGAPQRALIAVRDGAVLGAVIVSFAAEAPGLGSVGCTAVDPPEQGKGVAKGLVRRGTRELKRAGLPRAFIGYTYSGLEKLYGAAGYRISAFYFMAEKRLSGT